MARLGIPARLLLMTQLSLALPAGAYDLLQAWQAARDHHAGYAAAREDYLAGLEQARETQAALLPKIDLSANIARVQPIERGADGQQRTFGLQLKQPLFDIPRLSEFRKGPIRQQQAQTAFDHAGQQLMAEVASAYFNVLQAQDALAATETAKRAFARRLEQARMEFELGTATMLDAHEAQARHDGALAEEIQARSQLEVRRNALARLTGLPPDDLRPLAKGLKPSPPMPADLEAWFDLARQHSPRLRAKALDAAMAEQTLAERRGQRLPVAELHAGYQDNRQHFANAPNRARNATVGASVTMPLFAGGGLSARVREAALRLDSARSQQVDMQRQVREEVRQAWLGVTNGSASVRAQEQRLVSSRNKLAATELGQEVGIRTNLDLLTAQQEYSDALKELALSRYRYLESQLQLALAAGQMNEEALARVNRAITP